MPIFTRPSRSTARSVPRRRSRTLIAGLAASLTLGLAGCGDAGPEDEIVVAIVANPQMQDAISLQEEFERQHPDVDVRFVSLPENEARAKITASVATGGGEFDVVMISNYETPSWAENGWIENLQPYIDRTEGYDDEDFISSIREALSRDGDMYSVPFYGESSFLVYNKEMFAEAGVTMPEKPAWPEIREIAAELDDPDAGVSGICLRGLAGWGEVMAPLTTVMNTYGGGWFDAEGNPTLTSPETTAAVQDYVSLVQEHGQAGPATSGYGDCITLYSQGQTAMWYDATAMVSTIEDPKSSTVAGKNGYVPAPTMDTDSAGWLYTWSLAIPSTSDRKDAAWDFVSWMTDKEYIRLVGENIGWERVPPGSRYSTYEIPEYQDVSEAYARPTLEAMNAATQENSFAYDPRYAGLQFVAIPEFQDLGTRVGQQISAAIAGQVSVEEALEQSQGYAEDVALVYQRQGEE
ncbi:sugar ABC transporter substrate-binding protein [Micrococcus luteus]|uniref:ABC transporter substrate-binding protein n=1 Tax=Micrococcus luteus TaxID=1270 RepID=UPI001A961C95|nr:sugar ABC transporter substrate-binding protein [Micrococcus luteus]MBO1027871.1 sugar ABC transporter substrate-binding protein [Micrococcus luteus]MCV7501902.1 sugar ABC transporter substrate-binding protein [Micrococcus luteus]MCV7558147.1 sugar ABC transporter substrate-binding protein [Micrococcus luteus]